MANPYPIRIQGSDGIATLNGEATFTDPANQPGGGGSQPLKIVRFPFSHTDAVALATGITAYTPAAGELLVDGWFEGAIDFDGTTPLADFGTFVGASSGGIGFYANLSGPVNLLTITDAAPVCGDGLVQASGGSAGIAGRSAVAAPLPYVSDGTPIKVVASQDGTQGGTAIDSTAGAATLALLIAAA